MKVDQVTQTICRGLKISRNGKPSLTIYTTDPYPHLCTSRFTYISWLIAYEMMGINVDIGCTLLQVLVLDDGRHHKLYISDKMKRVTQNNSLWAHKKWSSYKLYIIVGVFFPLFVYAQLCIHHLPAYALGSSDNSIALRICRTRDKNAR